MSESLDTVDSPVRKISPILEIQAANYHHLRKICDPSVGTSLKEVLEQQTFDRTKILWASNPHVLGSADICEVAHFGHSISCDGACHGGGVYRLFETQLLIPEDVKDVISETWMVGENIRLDISHSGRVLTEKELMELPSGNTAVGRLERDYSPDKPGANKGEAVDDGSSSIGVGKHSSDRITMSSF